MALNAASTSSVVVSGPVVRRSEPCARSGSMPIASRTWLGSALPVVQALPVRRLDALEVERRDEVAALDAVDHDADVVRQPLIGMAGERHAVELLEAGRAAGRSARGADRPRRASACARRKAAANPTMPATFSVPARRWRSCEPPWSCGRSWVPRRT